MKRRLALLGMLVSIVVFFAVQPGFGQEKPKATAAAELASVPDDCGALAEPLPIHALIPHAVGAWPVFAALPNGDGTRGIMILPDERYHDHAELDGWYSTKAGWFVALAYTGEVRLRGANVEDGSPIYFEIGGNDAAETVTLNPATPGGFVDELDRWAFFPSGMWVSKAGCYRLEAEWDGGLWQQVIAVGSAGD